MRTTNNRVFGCLVREAWLASRNKATAGEAVGMQVPIHFVLSTESARPC